MDKLQQIGSCAEFGQLVEDKKVSENDADNDIVFKKRVRSVHATNTINNFYGKTKPGKKQDPVFAAALAVSVDIHPECANPGYTCQASISREITMHNFMKGKKEPLKLSPATSVVDFANGLLHWS